MSRTIATLLRAEGEKPPIRATSAAQIGVHPLDPAANDRSYTYPNLGLVTAEFLRVSLGLRIPQTGISLITPA